MQLVCFAGERNLSKVHTAAPESNGVRQGESTTLQEPIGPPGHVREHSEVPQHGQLVAQGVPQVAE